MPKEKEGQTKIDFEFFENIIALQCLTNESYLASVLDHLNPSYFLNKDIRTVVQVLKDFYIKRNSVPSLTEIKQYLTTEELKASFRNVVNGFKDLDRKFNDDELNENTERFLKERGIYNTMREVADDCARGKIDSAYILEKFEKCCSIALTRDVGHDYFAQLDKHIADLKQVDRTISTGYPWLDKKLGGGIQEKGRAMYIFAGETNVGKSIVLGNLAKNIAGNGKSVLVISLEMSELMYSKRFTANITGISMSGLRANADRIKEKVTGYKMTHPGSRLLIKEFPPSTITAQHLAGYIKKIKQKGFDVDAIVVDYINLLHSNLGNNSYERIKYVAEHIRALTYTFEASLISATQLNRSGYNVDSPGIDSTSESMALPNTADFQCGLWQQAEDRELGVLRMSIQKNRFGPNHGSNAFRIDYDTLTITEDDSLNETEESNETENALDLLKDA